ncbi:MAG TPA: 50S ribosomal protein L24 [Myxococcota bacterium]|nr:50S ribosomal protein L24 [Myxococcota bacterium]HQK49973.1 50S ribosomal protein L24 [Myxococcota bacterium]
MNKIRKNDEVVVLRGRNAGAKGKVLEVDGKSGRAVVEGVNLVKKHSKRKTRRLEAGIQEKPAPLPLSALSLVSRKDGKAVRVHFELREGSGGQTRKVRVASRTGEVFD